MTELHALLQSEDVPDTIAAPRPVACAYCREPVQAEFFVSLGTSTNFLSAECRNCERRMTVAAVTLQPHLMPQMSTSRSNREVPQ
jgi:hypothetical protein